MTVACLDMEGVLTPENWIAFADKVGIPDFKRTTRDEPDFDKLMHFRIDLMRKHQLTQVVIISDTFDIFGRPLMRKLGWPTLFHNTVEIDADGYMMGYKLRSQHTKRDTVRGLQSCGGVETIAAGDGYNDLEMIRASKAGFLFRAPEKIKTANPDVQTLEKYDDLFEAIMEALK